MSRPTKALEEDAPASPATAAPPPAMPAGARTGSSSSNTGYDGDDEGMPRAVAAAAAKSAKGKSARPIPPPAPWPPSSAAAPPTIDESALAEQAGVALSARDLLNEEQAKRLEAKGVPEETQLLFSRIGGHQTGLLSLNQGPRKRAELVSQARARSRLMKRLVYELRGPVEWRALMVRWAKADMKHRAMVNNKVASPVFGDKVFATERTLLVDTFGGDGRPSFYQLSDVEAIVGELTEGADRVWREELYSFTPRTADGEVNTGGFRRLSLDFAILYSCKEPSVVGHVFSKLLREANGHDDRKYQVWSNTLALNPWISEELIETLHELLLQSLAALDKTQHALCEVAKNEYVTPELISFIETRWGVPSLAACPESPLHIWCQTCREPSLAVAEALHQALPDAVSTQDSTGRTPLHRAAQNPRMRLSVLGGISKLNPSANRIQDSQQRTPLYYLLAGPGAADRSMVQCLLSAYPEGLHPNHREACPFTVACENPHLSKDVVSLLLAVDPAARFRPCKLYGNDDVVLEPDDDDGDGDSRDEVGRARAGHEEQDANEENSRRPGRRLRHGGHDGTIDPGCFPLHVVLERNASLTIELVRLFRGDPSQFERDPVSTPCASKCLALHHAACNANLHLDVFQWLTNEYPRAAWTADDHRAFPVHYLTGRRGAALHKSFARALLLAYPDEEARHLRELTGKPANCPPCHLVPAATEEALAAKAAGLGDAASFPSYGACGTPTLQEQTDGVEPKVTALPSAAAMQAATEEINDVEDALLDDTRQRKMPAVADAAHKRSLNNMLSTHTFRASTVPHCSDRQGHGKAPACTTQVAAVQAPGVAVSAAPVPGAALARRQQSPETTSGKISAQKRMRVGLRVAFRGQLAVFKYQTGGLRVQRFLVETRVVPVTVSCGHSSLLMHVHPWAQMNSQYGRAEWGEVLKAMVLACQHGHAGVLRLLLERVDDLGAVLRQLVLYQHAIVMLLAEALHRPNMNWFADWIRTAVLSGWSGLDTPIDIEFEATLRSGTLTSDSPVFSDERLNNMRECSVCSAVRYGTRATLEWLVGSLGRTCKCSRFSNGLLAALQGTDLPLLEYMISASGNRRTVEGAILDRVAESPATKSPMHIMRWAHLCAGSTCTKKGTMHAAVNGHCDMLRFLREKRNAAWPEHLIELSVAKSALGVLPVVEYLHRTGMDGITAKACLDAARARNVNIETLTYLIKHASEDAYLEVARSLDFLPRDVRDYLADAALLADRTTLRPSGFGQHDGQNTVGGSTPVLGITRLVMAAPALTTATKFSFGGAASSTSGTAAPAGIAAIRGHGSGGLGAGGGGLKKRRQKTERKTGLRTSSSGGISSSTTTSSSTTSSSSSSSSSSSRNRNRSRSRSTSTSSSSQLMGLSAKPESPLGSSAIRFDAPGAPAGAGAGASATRAPLFSFSSQTSSSATKEDGGEAPPARSFSFTASALNLGRASPSAAAVTTRPIDCNTGSKDEDNRDNPPATSQS